MRGLTGVGAEKIHKARNSEDLRDIFFEVISRPDLKSDHLIDFEELSTQERIHIRRGITTEDVINLASTGIVIALAKAQEQKIDLILKIREIRVIEAMLENQHLLVQPVVWRHNGIMAI